MPDDPDSRAYRTVLFTTMLNRMAPARRREYLAFHGYDFLAKPMPPSCRSPQAGAGGDLVRVPFPREAK